MASIGFVGGGKLDKALRKIADRLGRAESVKVGFLEDAKYPDGTPVAYVAAIQNFGAPAASIPPRPFFSSMVKAKSPEWGTQLGQILKLTQFDGERSLKMMGDGISGELVDSIKETDSPALSPVTLMLRKMYGGHPEEITGKAVGEAAARVAEGEEGATGTQAKPLVWTGHMENSVQYEVNDKVYSVGTSE